MYLDFVWNMKSVPKLFLVPTETCILNDNGYNTINVSNRAKNSVVGAASPHTEKNKGNIKIKGNEKQ